MAMTKCRECGTDVSGIAERCPKCGIEDPGVEHHKAKKSSNGCFLIIIIIVGVLYWINSIPFRTAYNFLWTYFPFLRPYLPALLGF